MRDRERGNSDVRQFIHFFILFSTALIRHTSAITAGLFLDYTNGKNEWLRLSICIFLCFMYFLMNSKLAMGVFDFTRSLFPHHQHLKQ